MKTAEATTLKSALTRLALGFPPTDPVQNYITYWKNDVDAQSNGTSGVASNTANTSEEGMLVVTVAALPSSPATNDEAIVTDSKALTPGGIVAGGGALKVYVKYDGSNWLIQPKAVTVASLPASPVTNDEAIVTDAKNITPGDTVVGAGTLRVAVRYNGSNWVIIPTAVTVATLPPAPSTNDEAVVTDATTATNGGTVAGSGSTRVLVRYDGANWKIV